MEEKQKKEQTEKGKKEPEELLGFQYMCRLFSIILHNGEKKNAYRQHERSGEPFNNGFKEAAVRDWTFMAKKVLDGSDVKWEKLLIFYYENAVDKKKDYEEDFRTYRGDVDNQYRSEGSTLANAFNNILVGQKATVPRNLFGFAVTLTLAVTENYKDDNFYMGQREAKELLFQAMKILGYRNVECIPDACFEDADGLKQLLLAALYHSMLVVFPRQNQKEKLYHDGRMVVENILKNSWESDLFLAVKQAAEAEKIVELLQEAQEKLCSTDTVFTGKKLPLDAFFTFPEIVSINPFPFLAYDTGSRIRTLIEGKSGSGKTCLAKAIVQACGNLCENEQCSREVMAKSGLNGRKLLPIILNCEELTAEELQQKRLLECALDRMHVHAQNLMYGDSDVQHTLEHYYENKQYIMTYMEREAARGNLLLLLDDFQKMAVAEWKLFLDKLRQLCENYPILHVVVFSNPLKPSDKRLFQGYALFQIGEFTGLEQVKEKVTAVAEAESMPLRECSADERMFDCFADTPGRLFRYLEQTDYTISELVCEGIEEEIESKHGTDISNRICKKFLMQLSVEALYRRNNPDKKLIIPGNIVTSHFLQGFEKDWRKEEGLEEYRSAEDRREVEHIWKTIQQKRILIEQSTFVNSYEFNNLLYFDSLLTDYLADVLEQTDQSTCAGCLLTIFAKLSAAEFSRVIPDLFYRISNVSSYYPATQISEENVSMLAKAVSGVAFSYAEPEESEECLNGLQELMKNEVFKDGFTRSGRYENRKSILTMLKRLQKSIINFGK